MINQSSWPKIRNQIGLAVLFITDILSIAGLFYLSLFLRKDILPKLFENLSPFRQDIGLYWWVFFIWTGVLVYKDGYSKRFAFWDEIKFLWQSAFAALLLIVTILFISKKGPEFSRLLIFTMTALSLPLFPLVRLSAKRALYRLGLMKRKVLILGSGETARKALKAIQNEPNLGYEVAGFIDDNPSTKEINGIKVHKGLKHIERYARSAGIHDAIIAKPELSGKELSELINHVQHKVENTLFLPNIAGIAVAGTQIRNFFSDRIIAIEVKNNLSNPLTYFGKRISDYALSILIFPFLLPVLCVIAAIIKYSSEGPVLYGHKRIGKKGKLFKCYKFRTMYKDAEEKLRKLLEKNPELKDEWESNFKLKNDPRITKIGNFLRKTSLDELPQIINVIRGEMSLVGPRPVIQKEITEYYKENAVYYFRVPPGVTGLWQVSGRSDTSYDCRISLDSWYVKNWSLWLDAIIFFKTIAAVLKTKGAR